MRVIFFFALSSIQWIGKLSMQNPSGGPKASRLFPVDHPNVTNINDTNFNTTVLGSQLPFVIDFYHPFCPLCQSIVPEWENVAAYFKQHQQGKIHIGAVSCMEETICRKMKIMGFPSIIAFNFNPAFKGENERLIGVHTLADMKNFVERLERSGGAHDSKEQKVGSNTPMDSAVLKGYPVNSPTPQSMSAQLAGGSHDPTIPPPPAGSSVSVQVAVPMPSLPNVPTLIHHQQSNSISSSSTTTSLPPPNPASSNVPTLPLVGSLLSPSNAPLLYENTTTPSNPVSRIQDAASAFIYALHFTIFTGEVLEDTELDALKEWIRVVSETFPGWFNRQLLSKLWLTVQYIPHLDFDTWKKILQEWQEATLKMYNQQTKEHLTTSQPWMQIPELFQGNGTTYRFCYSFTCGQWTLFHMLTVNPLEKLETDKQLAVAVVAAIRRFVKSFFGCADCRKHFMQANPLEVVTAIQNAEKPHVKLKMWLWEMHNTVNIRLRHPVWPKREVCPDCSSPEGWNLPKVEKWLEDFYSYKP